MFTSNGAKRLSLLHNMENEVCRKRMDLFCYVCGRFTIAKNRRHISDFDEQIYRCYFHMAVIRDAWWAPKTMCTTCRQGLHRWYSKKANMMPYAIPMIWSKPVDHQADNCYACANDVNGLNRHNRGKFVYKNVTAAIFPIPHDENLPVPIHPIP